MRIDACFDSHVHWAATGEFSQRLDLSGLSSADDVLTLNPQPAQFRGEWLLGFGWDESGWKEPPHRRVLDKSFPTTPVAFSRCDGHALWLNSEALRRSGLLHGSGTAEVKGGRVDRDTSGEATGVVVDQACEVVRAVMPALSAFEMRRHLLKGVRIFNEAGFTHIRDMTCDELQWSEAVRLDQSGLLTLAVEEYFHLKEVARLEDVLRLALEARSVNSPNLRVKGIKIFLDGALGSEGAWLSRCYHGREHRGTRLWQDDEMKEVLQAAWRAGLEVAVHAIGDQAVDEVVDIALELKHSGVGGHLHIEHGELIRPATIEKMKTLPVICHMQPAHWLTDRAWLGQKTGELAAYAFPWRRLQEAGVEFDFGSDAPIEPPDVKRTIQALRESAEAGVPRLLGSPASHLAHGDPAWAPNSFTIFEDEIPRQVVFRGEHILSADHSP